MESSNVLTLFTFMLCAALTLLLSPSPSAARNLIINDISFRNTNCPVVYEIPDDDGRADAIRHIERMRDRLNPNVDIIDAATADDSILREKLKDGFTLFTTISDTSRLFKATTQPLSVRIEEDILNWNGLSASVGELQVIAVGKNPYGDGHCLVFAAGSNELLVNIESFHGHCSYHIFQEGKPRTDGYYREDFTVAKDCISSAEAEADVKQFFLTLQRVHPDLLARVSVEDYIKLKQQITENIVKQSNDDGEISVNDLAYMLFYAAAFFGDGHTSVHWRFQPNDSNTVGIRFPPFLLGCDNGRFVILASSYDDIAGMELLSVNDKPIREALSPILDRCSGETFAFKAARFTGDQSFWYAFCKPYGSDEILSLELANATGEEVVREVATVGLTDFQKILSDWKVGKQRKTQRQGTRVEFLDSGRIAHFTYPQFTLSDYEKKMVDSVFEEIKASKSSELIIDLRGNGGGNSFMGNVIFSYLYAEPFFTFSKGCVRLSPEVISAHYKGEIPESAELEGLILADTCKEESVAKPNAFFSGQVFLLVDNHTFSSAAGLAAMFRDYGVGTIVGYETGGVPVSFGDVFTFELENTGIRCGVSYKQFFCPKPRPGDDERGVLPDIPMTHELLRQYQNEDDPVLAYTLDHIKKIRRK